ncbi:MAG: DUF3313 domain-containing protein [bacterium]|nr:DUF3313 domain-containing protein [bacterium]
MKRAALFVVVGILVVGFQPVARANSDFEVVGLSDLEKTKGRFAENLVHPSAELSKYDKVYPMTAYFQFNDQGITIARTGTVINSKEHASLFAEEDNCKRFKDIVAGAFVNEFRERGFEIVKEASPTTLVLRAALIDIQSNMPAESTRNVAVSVVDIGEASVVVELVDSQTGVIQLRVEERRQISRVDASMAQFDPSGVWTEFDRWARRVARDLGRTLEKLTTD